MMRTRFIAVAGLMLLVYFAAGQTPEPVSLPVGSATIADFKGEVTLHSLQGDVTANRGLVLAPESVIETGKGSTLLNLPDGSQVLVKPHSKIILKAPTAGKGYSLELIIGKILAKIQKRIGGNPSFRMGTPTAVITVRGTRFEVEVDKKQRTFVEVYEGLVEVAGLRDNSRPVFMRPGFMTRVQMDRDPDEPHQRFGGDDRGISRRGDDDNFSRPGAPGGEYEGRGSAPNQAGQDKDPD
jgi:hypothetical protein